MLIVSQNLAFNYGVKFIIRYIFWFVLKINYYYTGISFYQYIFSGIFFWPCRINIMTMNVYGIESCFIRAL